MVRGYIRDDLHLPEDLRRLAKAERIPRTARRMLGIANAMEGMTFSAAAAVLGLERQSLERVQVRRTHSRALSLTAIRPYGPASAGAALSAGPHLWPSLCACVA